MSFGQNLILRDINIEIKDVIRPGLTQGQVVGFLGPSGRGKTQLFRILAGLNPPTTGTVKVNSTGDPVKSGMVGVVPQSYPLFEHRTVLANLILAARQHGFSLAEAQKRSKSMLERFNLAERKNFYPAQLSGGQRQRIAIARQLLCSEHFLLMDEPFSGLDIIAKQNACSLIAEVAAADELNTIIVCTHDIESAIAIADTVWLLGYERNAAGEPIPGAKIIKTYNLMDMGLAWHKDVHLTPEFSEFVREVKGEFITL